MTIYATDYYVYAYLRKADLTPYYIGKGKNNRAFSNFHRVAVPKDQSRIIIISNNLTEFGAYALERWLIRWYGRKDNSTGILRNMTDGGEGGTGRAAGFIHTQTTREKISNAHKGKTRSLISRQKQSESISGTNNHNYGKEKTAEIKEKISIANRGKVRSIECRENHSKKMRGPNNPNYKKGFMLGVQHTKEARIKISEALKGKKKTIITCPHCNFTGGLPSLKRWHFDNCKIKPRHGTSHSLYSS